MYTQCPDCRAAFHVTASVLQEAAGKVRCGGCGQAFNALDRLSEDRPDGDGNDSSVDRRKTLLDTLDEITGTDNIRIEDTGVEWRVLDEVLDAGEADDGESGRSDDAGGGEAVDSGDTSSVRWFIDDPPPDNGDRETGDGKMPGAASARQAAPVPTTNPQAALNLPPAAGDDEERYDDNTPLPGALDDDGDATSTVPEPPRRRAEDLLEPHAPEFDERQVDLALSEPEDWTDLLDEVDTVAAEELSLVPDDEPSEPATADEQPPADEDGGGAWIDVAEADEHDDREPTGEFERRVALAAAALARNDSGSDDESREQSADESGQSQAGSEAPPPEAATPGHYVPPQTEEEMTINRLIDQDLLRLAENEDVFTATIAGAGRHAQHESPHVETIIMEGEFVRNSLEAVLPAADIEVEAPVDEPRSLKDTYIRTRDRIRGGRRRTDPPSYTAIAGVAALGLLLAAQLVHAYRESLATSSAFNHTVGSLYRLFGAPITPEWNVNGWQFEATSGRTDAFDQALTISSRITNRSDRALPYPLLHVSLTDRYEEIVGSRLVQPGQYLSGPTARGTVAPGEKFTADVMIASLSPDATGFKLNVCYQLTDEQLRCATGAFKE